MKKKEIKLDALKLIAESYGFELVEKKREIKVGDFGKFWDGNCDGHNYGFLIEIKKGEIPFIISTGFGYNNFSHLTDEEKKQIQENW